MESYDSFSVVTKRQVREIKNKYILGGHAVKIIGWGVEDEDLGRTSSDIIHDSDEGKGRYEI